MKERLSTRKTLKREEHASSYFPLKGRTLLGTLGAALVVLVTLVVLVACPATPSGGGGTGYVCANGTPSSLRDATADGLIRCVSCNPLYRLDDPTDVVGRSCRPVALGEATRIGSVSQFDVRESSPTGLAAIDGTLYMVGQSNGALFTLDTASGVATRVSDAAVRQFGVGEGQPTGLAAINNTLYMVGLANAFLYTLDTTTGMAARVGSGVLSGFGMGERAPTGLASIDNTLYMAGVVNQVLYTLDTTSGMATQVSASSVSQFGVSESIPNGLAAIDGTLYLLGQTNGVLYTLNIGAADGTPDGMAIQVGSATTGFGLTGISPAGLAAIDSALYMVGTGSLYALRYQ